MSEPKRIQLRRTKGWRKPPDAIVVARPTRWGNPYTLDQYRIDYDTSTEREQRAMAVSDYRGLVEGRWDKFDDTPPHVTIEEIREVLAGHDLACWCPITDADGNRVPCHADVLLDIANDLQGDRPSL